jgi:hypothetical protein
MKAVLRKALDVWLGGDDPTPARLCRSALVVFTPALVAHLSLQMLLQPNQDSLSQKAQASEHLEQQLDQLERLITGNDSVLAATMIPEHSALPDLQGCHRHVQAEIGELHQQLHKLLPQKPTTAVQPQWQRQAMPNLMAAKLNLEQCQKS